MKQKRERDYIHCCNMSFRNGIVFFGLGIFNFKGLKKFVKRERSLLGKE